MDYLEQCLRFASHLRDSDLGSRIPSEEIEEGSTFVFQTLGQISLGGVSVYTGLKMPYTTGATVKRLTRELSLIDFLTSQSPSIWPKVPIFMCRVHFSGTEVDGLLVEDVSKDNTLSVMPNPASESTRKEIYKPFSAFGDEKNILSEETLEVTTACVVDSEERLIDFTPYPIRSRVDLLMLLEPAADSIRENMEALTVPIAPSSPLGQAALFYY